MIISFMKKKKYDKFTVHRSLQNIIFKYFSSHILYYEKVSLKTKVINKLKENKYPVNLNVK